MELSVLNSGFKRAKMVQNWNSLVWTERFSSNGDFELVSNNVADIMAQLPLPSDTDPPLLVAIGESNVPMVVETHKIEKGKDGVPKITTSGRSFETVLDRRVTIRAITSGVARVEWQVDATSAALAAYTVAKTIMVDGAATALDIIPEINLLNSVGTIGVSQKFPVEPKELYAWMLETLALSKYGLKAALDGSAQIAVIIYQGTDRQTSVVFDVALEQIEDATYLLSKLGYKNTMITGTTNGMEVSDTGVPRSGLARRADFQDLSSDVTLPAGADLTNLTINKGKVALADRLPTALFSGGVADSVGSGYNRSYFLGDVVKLQGEYGLSQIARVAEFVRTHDTTGIKAYPTFEAVTP
jgi:hypothetical protein